MMIRVLLATILAGALAGCFATAAQSYRIVPLIMAAEEFEHAAAPAADHEAHGHEHGHADNAHVDTVWQPENGIERAIYRLLSNLVIGVSFALMLTGAVLLSNQSLSLGSGLLWGACGFIAFVLAPNLGLPPELPGMASADLGARQLWWLGTVVTTAAGLWIFAFKRSPAWMVLGVALFVSMHVIGAPRVDGGESGVPAELAAEFAIATVVGSALFWLVLGGLLGLLVGRVTKDSRAGLMSA
jgi:cobalt transporter subunit CbtA